MPVSPEVLDCVVVGGGPAGLVAGLYLRRFLRRVCVIDAGAGRAHKISCSHNVAGFPDGISGPQLLERMTQHLRQAGGEVIRGTVRELQHAAEGDGFAVGLGHETLRSRTVMLCTGVRDRLPDLPGAADLEAADLLRYCPVCDGYEHRSRRIGVIGRSAHGVREAVFLQHFSPHVCFVDAGGAAEALQAAEVPSLRGRPSRLAVGPEGGALVTTDDGSVHRFDLLYAALGVDPGVELVAGLGVALDAVGNIVTDTHGRTNVPGLYAAGDVVQALDQIGVAVGQAAIAATAVHNSLRNAA